MKKLKGLKGKRGLKGLPGSVNRRQTQPEGLEKLKESLSQHDEQMSYYEQVAGSKSKAKQLLELHKDYPAATVIELIAIHFLKKRNIRFVYQLNVRGGRVSKGGIVPDLVVFQDPFALVWQINGNYWHSNPARHRMDERARVLLLNQTIEGRRVIAVVDLWESRLKEDADRVCQSALLGINEGP